MDFRDFNQEKLKNKLGIGPRENDFRSMRTILNRFDIATDALVMAGMPSLEALLQVDAGDLAEIEAIGESASGILEAARQELARRNGESGLMSQSAGR